MKTVELRTAEGRTIAAQVCLADSFASRYVGLLRRLSLQAQEGLLLSAAGGIHTIGLRSAIDVVFLSRQMRIIGLAASVPPWHFRRAPAGTGRVLELAAGRIAATGLAVGTYVVVESGADDQRPRARCTTCPTSTASLPPCERLPLRFSLRLPLQHRGTANDDECSPRTGQAGRSGAGA